MLALMTMMLLLLLAQDWPSFRGPGGQGHSPESGLPLEWTATEHVAWKTPIPGEGWSSPVVWQDKVYVTAATEGGTQCRVLCLSAADGAILWNKHVFDQVPSRKEGKNSYATPTPVVDGRQIFAVFGDGSAVALGLDGTVAWTNRDVKFYSRHGLGSSPVLHDGLLIMPYDGSKRVEAAGQYPKVTDEERTGWQLPWDQAELVALDATSGKRVWTGKRGQSRIAHTTPLLYTEGGVVRLLSVAGDVVQSFDPKSGERIWSVAAQGEGTVPTPVIADGLVFTSSGYEKTMLRAVKLDGKGIVWEQKKGTPTQPSLLYVKPYLYGVTDNGVATCWQPATGEIVWQERLGEKQIYSASPVFADGRIYLLSEKGETVVLAPGAEFKVLARNPLGEKCQASMAVSRGRFYIRTERTLFAIGGK